MDSSASNYSYTTMQGPPSPSTSPSLVHFKKRAVREYAPEPSPAQTSLEMSQLMINMNLLAAASMYQYQLAMEPSRQHLVPSPATSHDSGFADVNAEPLDLTLPVKVSPSPLASLPTTPNCLPISPSLLIDESGAASPSAFGPSKYVCPQCNKSYKSASQYRAHVRRHESKQTGRYSCSACNKCFVQRSSLKTHERIHTGEKPYNCGVCGDAFGDFSTYTKHKRTHTGEKPYDCPICNRSFSQSGNMHRHLKIVHKDDFPLLARTLNIKG